MSLSANSFSFMRLIDYNVLIFLFPFRHFVCLSPSLSLFIFRVVTHARSAFVLLYFSSSFSSFPSFFVSLQSALCECASACQHRHFSSITYFFYFFRSPFYRLDALFFSHFIFINKFSFCGTNELMLDVGLRILFATIGSDTCFLTNAIAVAITRFPSSLLRLVYSVFLLFLHLFFASFARLF